MPNDKTRPRVHAIEVSNFLGIREVKIQFPASGALISGGNGVGKTSIIEAIRTALDARGIDGTAIRRGATKAEIFLDLGHVTVSRIITTKSNKLLVKDHGDQAATGALLVRERHLGGGTEVARPQSFLADMLGLVPLDPLRLFREEDRRAQREMILEAVHVDVTIAELRAWIPGLQVSDLADVLKLPLDPENEAVALPLHGLAVLERLGEHYYTERTARNRIVTQAAAAERSAREREASLASELFALAPEGEPMAPETAAEALAQARQAHRDLDSARRKADADSRRQAQTRETIAGLRRQGAAIVADLDADPTEARLADLEAAEAEARTQHDAAIAEEARLADLLQKARAHAGRCQIALAARAEEGRLAQALLRDNREARAQAMRLDEQATQIEQALGEAPVPPVPEDFAQAQANVQRAERLLACAHKGAELAGARAALAAAHQHHEEALAMSTGLTRIIDTLRGEAQAELLRTSNGIPGLSISGDDVLLDGVALAHLCGRERLEFAVEVARRLNRKACIIIVDALEALDPDQLPIFLAKATADGYQVIATRVSRGEAEIIPIEPAESEAGPCE